TVRGPRPAHALDLHPERHDGLASGEPPERMREHAVEPGITQGDERTPARDARRPGILRLELLDDPREHRLLGERLERSLAPAHVEVDLDVPEEHGKGGGPDHRPFARPRDLARDPDRGEIPRLPRD